VYVTVGTYTGSGASNPQTGFGFAPVVVFIKRHGSTNAAAQLIKTGGVTHYKAIGANAVVDDTNATLDADGFTPIANVVEINTAAGTYEYIAWGAASADMAVFEYAGDTSDNRDVGAFTFTPNMAWVLPSGTGRAMWRSDQLTGDLSQRFDVTATTNNIQAFGAGTIQVGTALDAGSTNYYVAVWKTATGVFALTEYAGNGSDNRDVAHGLTVSPAWAYVQTQDVSTQIGTMRFSTDVGDVSHPTTAVADAADQIQSMDATNVNLGAASTVNLTTGTPTYTLVTFGANLPSVGSSGLLPLLGVG
jgi:hypothetical protein